MQLTALSIEGCTNVYTDNMVITPNTLTGNITTAPPSPLCEGESTTLTAPAGGISWEWSNNSTSNNITITESGIYTVTLTDATGCTYAPPPAQVDVFGEPNGIIKAVEYNEFGQPVAFFETSHSVCEGDDVFLVVQGSLNNSYRLVGRRDGRCTGVQRGQGQPAANRYPQFHGDGDGQRDWLHQHGGAVHGDGESRPDRDDCQFAFGFYL
ncbi:MAG: hypothetical protein IPM82_05920 [Saprospiraceae bacterium]|nr:hypothetical protein [Saprospiraceae bacterium]